MGRVWVPLSAKSLMLLNSGGPAPATKKINDLGVLKISSWDALRVVGDKLGHDDLDFLAGFKWARALPIVLANGLMSRRLLGPVP